MMKVSVYVAMMMLSSIASFEGLFLIVYLLSNLLSQD
jgi:hypothetical protein